MIWKITFLLSLACLAGQGALKVMTIGDSLTEEYHFETPFSAPDSDPANANTMNWVEILAERRGADISFGDYEGVQLAYPDYRRSGHEYNWGIPGHDTEKWKDIIEAPTGLFDISLESLSRKKMHEQYDEVDVVVVMVGGNDVRSGYGDLYDALPGDATATSIINSVVSNLEDIINEIRSIESNLPIVLADVPDLGAVPDKIADYPDPLKRANATAIINDLNVAVASMALSNSVTLAKVSQLTTDILKPEPFYVGALQMLKGTHPENPANYLFCKAGLHPSTNGQAIIANILLAAINSATSSNIDLLPDREIITHLLELNPDQPFIDWATGKGITNFSITLDSDGDGIPNLGEYLLGLDPFAIDHVHHTETQEIDGVPMLTMDYMPDENAARLADIEVKQSTNLDDWSLVSPANIHPQADGSMQVRLPFGLDGLFVKLEFNLRP